MRTVVLWRIVLMTSLSLILTAKVTVAESSFIRASRNGKYSQLLQTITCLNESSRHQGSKKALTYNSHETELNEGNTNFKNFSSFSSCCDGHDMCRKVGYAVWEKPTWYIWYKRDGISLRFAKASKGERGEYSDLLQVISCNPDDQRYKMPAKSLSRELGYMSGSQTKLCNQRIKDGYRVWHNETSLFIWGTYKISTQYSKIYVKPQRQCIKNDERSYLSESCRRGNSSKENLWGLKLAVEIKSNN